MQVVILTDDSYTTDHAVAKQLGITQVESEVMPDQKAEIVKRLQAKDFIVAMAGYEKYSTEFVFCVCL